MSKRSNGFLCNKNFVTNRAVLTLCQAGVGTVGCNCGIHCLGMSKCVKCLCFRLAARAGALLLTLLGAGGLFDGRPFTKHMHVRLGFGRRRFPTVRLIRRHRRFRICSCGLRIGLVTIASSQYNHGYQ